MWAGRVCIYDITGVFNNFPLFKSIESTIQVSLNKHILYHLNLLHDTTTDLWCDDHSTNISVCEM